MFLCISSINVAPHLDSGTERCYVLLAKSLLGQEELEMSLQMKAVLAGVFFGIWPLLMNRSGLTGNVSSACFSAVTLMFVLPFALSSSGFAIPTANWTMVAAAGFIGALGLLSFNGMLAGASLQEVGTLFVLMTVVQITVAAFYQTIMAGGIPPLEKVGGYTLAAASAYLLLR